MTSGGPLDALAPLVGEWSMTATFEDLPPTDAGAHVSFEWLPGRQFLIQRWEIEVPEAPDGIALIGADPARPGGYLQHYFDTRGVARVYEMSFDGRVWRLERTKPDFSPFDFSQRFTGTLTNDGTAIEGTWEIAEDHRTWRKDFDLIYTRVT